MLQEKIIRGVFIEELKNRFLCSVMIKGSPTECYVPSSCRLDNFIDLRGKQVLLLPTQSSTARTPYSLFAVPYKRSYILLNTSHINSVIAKNLNGRYFSALGKRDKVVREHTISGYRSDIFLPESNTVIEIKSILSLEKKAVFPTVFSQRAVEQFTQIHELQKSGYNTALVIVSLNPYVDCIKIDYDSWFGCVISPCIEAGMQLLGYSVSIQDSEVQLKKSVLVE